MQNVYRNTDWIAENYEYSSCLVKKRIDELTTKWFSSSCYLKMYNRENIRLTAMNSINKDELVAKYSDPLKIIEQAHYIRNNEDANLYLSHNGEVYAKYNIQPETELTLNFNQHKKPF